MISVRAEQTLITLETDKAAMEVPSPVAGTVLEMKVAQGGRVSTGDLIAYSGCGRVGSRTRAGREGRHTRCSKQGSACDTASAPRAGALAARICTGPATDR